MLRHAAHGRAPLRGPVRARARPGRRRQPRLHRHRRRPRDAEDPGRHGVQGRRRRSPGRIRAWHHGHIRATRSTRARELLTELTPALLTSLQDQPDRDAAFRLFDEFLTGLPSGVQLFSLLRANPELLEPAGRPDGRGAAPGPPSEQPCRPVRRHAHAGLLRAPAGPGHARGRAALAAGRRARPAGHARHLPPLGARPAVPGRPADPARGSPAPRPRRARWPTSPRW